jgi:hypothetical protein
VEAPHIVVAVEIVEVLTSLASVDSFVHASPGNLQQKQWQKKIDCLLPY